jgi:hypothetical protein
LMERQALAQIMKVWLATVFHLIINVLHSSSSQ